jgi:Mg-chelatase subunit ChlI
LRSEHILPVVKIPENVTTMGLELVRQFKIDSLRAEVTLFEGARALAALDGRQVVSCDDLQTIAPMALRMRRSSLRNISDQLYKEEIKNNQQGNKTQ